MTKLLHFNKWYLPLLIVLFGGFVKTTNLHAQSTLPEGGLSGVFSVSNGNYVIFSQGNLQYKASTKTWRFAENQYDYIGDANSNISSAYSDYIDLFGWGTSGYNHGAVCYRPWSTSTNYSDYCSYYDVSNSLYDKADWGYNAISNGGNQEDIGWRTLTKQEWQYLFYTRSTSSGYRYAKAIVNNVNGVILLPDDWQSSYYTLYSTNTSNASFSSNTITAAQWPTLEQHGAVFLPAAGYRSGASVINAGSYGVYWSRSYYSISEASCLYFRDSHVSSSSYISRYYGLSVRLVFPFQVYSFGINASSNPAEGGVVSGADDYQVGTCCTLTATVSEGYHFVNWTYCGMVVSNNPSFTFTVTAPRTLVANFSNSSPVEINGALNGLFSVGDSTIVFFSQGNLQYKATSNTWRFAENQWEYVGDGNANISETYDGWIDLFGWGTSGYNHGAVCYQPWGTSSQATNYFAYGRYNCNLYDQDGRADWGYNAISNGGNRENTWRTLTRAEWDYVFNTRNTTSNMRYAKAVVNNVNGVILLPDDWHNSYYNLSSVNKSDASFTSNTINTTQWTTLEQHGAVFMPAAGNRNGTSVNNAGDSGYYWSSTLGSTWGGWGVSIWDTDIRTDANTYRYYGRSVRLVLSLLNSSFSIAATGSPMEGGTVSGEGIYEEGVDCTLTATASAGYHFVNWTESGMEVSTNSTYTFTVTGDRTLVANFAPNTYTVTLNTNDGAINSGNVTSYTYGEGITLPADVTRTGYTFGGWYDNADLTGAAVTAVSTSDIGDKEFWAKWTINSYTIGASANPTVAGTVNGAGTFNHGESCTLTATASDGYAFENWTEDGVEVSREMEYTFTVEGARTLVANFTLDIYAITAEANPTEGGTVTGEGFVDGEGDFAYGSTCTLTATANEGYTFINWTKIGVEVATTATYTFTVEAPTILVANFSLNSYEITASANPTAGGTVSGAGTYNYGASCTLTATAADGYTFENWTEDGVEVSRDMEYTFTVNGARTLVANFTLDIYAITVDANPVEGGTVTGAGTYNYGASCTLTATANEGYVFGNWTENGLEVSTNASYSFTVMGNRELAANFVFEGGDIAVDGALPGAFSVGENLGVVFSQGNLQYIGSAETPYWKFADKQWDYLGSTTGQYSADQDVDRDLFGWGTSSYNHGALCYQPWSISTADIPGPYYAYGSITCNLFDGSGQADWGYNAILNGGNQENSGWRTLTHEEWAYLFNTRCTPSGIRFAKAIVNNVNGVILLPDDWSSNTYPLNNTNNDNSDYSSNVIAATQWTTLEQYGAVFLPAAGQRMGTMVFDVGSVGGYWSASYFNDYYSYGLYFCGGACLDADDYQRRYYGQSVRLVRSCSFVSTIANPAEGGSVSCGGFYETGSECTVTAVPSEGYHFVNWTRDGVVVSANAQYTFTASGVHILVANFQYDVSEGFVNGSFSVGNGHFVLFSQGNLQYIGDVETPYWKFADHQWDNLGIVTGQNGSDQNVDRDLFGWGTSGYNHGEVCYQPWSTNITNSDYYAYGSDTYNLFDQTGQADWGYNAILNGGNKENSGWRSLRHEEWRYLFNSRSTVTGIRYAKANVNNVNGVILLPDDWKTSYFSLANTNMVDVSFSSNSISAEQWCILEQHGAVFLPIAGYRYETSVYNTGYEGVYWSASMRDSNRSWGVRIIDSDLDVDFIDYRYYGYSVRLVRETQGCLFVINVISNPEEGGSVTGAGTYTHGETVTLTATANEGYLFDGWVKDGETVSTEPSLSFTAIEDGEYVAQFTLQSYPIEIMAFPTEGGMVTGAGTYYHGDICTLTATPNTGYVFLYWIKDGVQVSTEASYTFTVTGPATYVANFVNFNYEVSVVVNPAEAGTVQGAGNYDLGLTCTLTATPNEGYQFVNWTVNGEEVSADLEYSFTVTEPVAVEANFRVDAEYHEFSLTPGWNWWSTYIEMNGVNGLALLEDALGTSGIQIKSQSSFVTYDEGWFGTLNGIVNEQSYRINMGEGGDYSLAGTIADPTAHLIAIGSGWNWIGYVENVEMDLNTAMANLDKSGDDIVKSRDYFSTYYAGYGWWGTLESLQPGGGYMYKASASGTLVYPEASKAKAIIHSPEAATWWIPVSGNYADNMSVMAVVEVNGEEVRSEEVEIGAFSQGECRGAVRLLYVAPLDRYVAFLTVHGEDGDGLSFRLKNDEGVLFARDRAVFAKDAVLGSTTEPYVLRFGNTGVTDAAEPVVTAYPNPSTGVFQLEGEGMERVEVYTMLGELVRMEEVHADTHTLNLSGCAEGMYHLRVHTQNGLRHLSVVVAE